MKRTKDGKRIKVKNNLPVPSKKVINEVYTKIDDDVKIPLVFKTKKQYLESYIKNQENKYGIKFTEAEKRQYINSELKNMQGIVSRYTTKKNPYMNAKVVFFNDKKINNNYFKYNVLHEYGHELYERNPSLRIVWNSMVNKNNSQSMYGKTCSEEDFAESYALFKLGKLKCNKRKSILRNLK